MIIEQITQTGARTQVKAEPSDPLRDGTLLSHFGLEVAQGGGSGATWTVNLEGSLDGVTWTPILTHTDANPGDGQVFWNGAGKFPCRHRRINVVALSLGTNTYLNVKLEGTP